MCENIDYFMKLVLKFILESIFKSVLFFGTFAKFKISSDITVSDSFSKYSYLSLCTLLPYSGPLLSQSNKT